MAYKALIFGTDDIYKELKPFYEREVQRGNLEIVAYAELENDNVNFVYADGRRGGGLCYFQLRSHDNLFSKKLLPQNETTRILERPEGQNYRWKNFSDAKLRFSTLSKRRRRLWISGKNVCFME